MTAPIALIRKDLILFLSNRRALLLSLLMPVVLGAFFGYLNVHERQRYPWLLKKRLFRIFAVDRKVLHQPWHCAKYWNILDQVLYSEV